MRKLFFITILLLVFSTLLFSLEIKLKNKFEHIESNPILKASAVIDLFYTNENELVVIYSNRRNRVPVYKIKEDAEVVHSIYEENIESGIFNQFIKRGVSFSLKYGYKVIFSSKEIYFYNEFIETEFGDNPAPYYMYINDRNDNIIFNFNTWRLDKSEFYPKTYYNSLSEKKEYTLEQQINLLNVCPASTEWKNHTAVNKKQNRIAVVFDKYNGERGALVIFEVLYDAVCNDDKVRVRSEPNLDCETVTYLNKNDAVKIKDQSDRKFEIDGEKWYWHQVETSDGKIGWVYGKYLDIEE